jgi:murein DD-endopeptidase MepM/ murein hydrolase activator NlpD
MNENSTINLDIILKSIEQFAHSQNIFSGLINRIHIDIEDDSGKTFSLAVHNNFALNVAEFNALPLTVESPIDPFKNPELAPTDAAGKNINGARFGCSRNEKTKWHGGLDLKASVGTDLKAIYSGIVTLVRTRARTDPDYYADDVGNFIIVKTNQGFSYKYTHLSEIMVTKGQSVTQGAIIAKSGDSGNAKNVPFKHLHIEVSTDHFNTNKFYVDPEPYISTKFGSNPNPLHCTQITATNT